LRLVEGGFIAEDERIEVLGGEIVPMQAKGTRHEAIKGSIVRWWGGRVPETHSFIPETGLTLDDYTYLEPDFIVFDRSVGLANVRGPDVLLAVEVADSSLDYDLIRKPAIYAQFGVCELWVIDAAHRIAHVHTEPGGGRYRSVVVQSSADRL